MEGVAWDGHNPWDWGSDQGGEEDDGDGDSLSDGDGGGTKNSNDLYSRPSPGM